MGLLLICFAFLWVVFFGNASVSTHSHCLSVGDDTVGAGGDTCLSAGGDCHIGVMVIQTPAVVDSFKLSFSVV